MRGKTELTALDDIATAINREHMEVGASLRRGLEHARRAGELLIQAKGQVGHGEWLPWLKDHPLSALTRARHRVGPVSSSFPFCGSRHRATTTVTQHRLFPSFSKPQLTVDPGGSTRPSGS